jgi:hypothetical protein
MSNSLKKEKVVVDGDFDQHDDARGDEVEKGYDVDAAEHVEDHVSWTSQGSFEQRSHSHGMILPENQNRELDADKMIPNDHDPASRWCRKKIE